MFKWIKMQRHIIKIERENQILLEHIREMEAKFVLERLDLIIQAGELAKELIDAKKKG
jgi:hypothetical protein